MIVLPAMGYLVLALIAVASLAVILADVHAMWRAARRNRPPDDLSADRLRAHLRQSRQPRQTREVRDQHGRLWLADVSSPADEDRPTDPPTP